MKTKILKAFGQNYQIDNLIWFKGLDWGYAYMGNYAVVAVRRSWNDMGLPSREVIPSTGG